MILAVVGIVGIKKKLFYHYYGQMESCCNINICYLQIISTHIFLQKIN